jgi:hypothetical protein
MQTFPNPGDQVTDGTHVMTVTEVWTTPDGVRRVKCAFPKDPHPQTRMFTLGCLELAQAATQTPAAAT